MKDKEWVRYSLHHILPRSMCGSSESVNLEYLRETQHRALHTLFQNKLIAEQLLTTVELSEKALRDDVREWLIETLTKTLKPNDPYERYKSDAIK